VESEASEIVNGAGGHFLAGYPFWIEEGVRAGMDRELLGDVEEMARGVCEVDTEQDRF
jgi:hypothetical protein